MTQDEVNVRAELAGLRFDADGALWGSTNALRAFALALLRDAGRPVPELVVRKPLARQGMQALVRTALEQDQLLHDHVVLIRAVEAEHGIGEG